MYHLFSWIIDARFKLDAKKQQQQQKAKKLEQALNEQQGPFLPPSPSSQESVLDLILFANNIISSLAPSLEPW